MDIHVNDLIIEDGFKDIPLDSLSFRDIDQEFLFVRTTDSFDSDICNILYYCFIKPYEGLYFRRIGETDEGDNHIYVDEGMIEIEDLPYEDLKYKMVSKIMENGDLISNQLLVDIPFDYYSSNDKYEELIETRKITWVDEKREQGNPDIIFLEGEQYKLKMVIDNDLIIEGADGHLLKLSSDFTCCSC